MNKFLRIWLSLVTIMISSIFNSDAQNLGKSIYTSYGIGDINDHSSLQSSAMGNTGISFHNPSNINLQNPASYSDLQLTTFEIGAMSTFRTSTYSNITTKYDNTSFSHLAIAFPVSKKWASSFGIMPYSSVGYKTKEVFTIDQNNVSVTDSGTGGFNKFFIGNSFKPFKFLSIGVNISYFFGSINKYNLITFDNTQTIQNENIEKIINASGFYYDFGLNYHTNIRNDWGISIGLCGAPKIAVRASSKMVTELYSSINPYATDTVSSTPNTNGTIDIPMFIGAGLSLKKAENFLWGFDVRMQDWTGFKIMNTPSANSGNSLKISSGIEYCKDPKAIGHYMSKIKYRIGFKYCQNNVIVKSNPLIEESFSIGFGLPVPKQRFPGELNIGIEAGRRYINSANTVEEEFIRFYLGLSLSDKWFEKRKFD